jgi:hypothetical protein
LKFIQKCKEKNTSNFKSNVWNLFELVGHFSKRWIKINCVLQFKYSDYVFLLRKMLWIIKKFCRSDFQKERHVIMNFLIWDFQMRKLLENITIIEGEVWSYSPNIIDHFRFNGIACCRTNCLSLRNHVTNFVKVSIFFKSDVSWI